MREIFGTRRRTVINITSWLFPSVFREIYIITAIRPPPVNVHVACRVQTRLTSSPVRSLQLTWLIFSRANNTRLNPPLFPLACDKRENSRDLIYGMWSTRLGGTRQTDARGTRLHERLVGLFRRSQTGFADRTKGGEMENDGGGKKVHEPRTTYLTYAAVQMATCHVRAHVTFTLNARGHSTSR